MLWFRHSFYIPRAFYEAIGSRRATSSKPEQSLKGGHREPAAIVTKGELVQINLELSAADTMIRADKPLLKISDRAVG